MKLFTSVISLLLFLTAATYASDEAYSTTITVEKILSTDTTAAGQKLKFPPNAAAMTGIIVTIPAGAETGWHTHDYSGFAYVLEGVLTVKTKEGTRVFPAGSSFAEVVDIAHNGINKGTAPVKLVAFFSAPKGEPISNKVTQ